MTMMIGDKQHRGVNIRPQVQNSGMKTVSISQSQGRSVTMLQLENQSPNEETNQQQEASLC